MRVKHLGVAFIILVCCVLIVEGFELAWLGKDDRYYCIEGYKPIGQPIKNVTVNNSSAQLQTAGHTARLCSAACDAEPACTAFRSVAATDAQNPSAGAAGTSSSSCELLANSAAALPAALAQPEDADWPTVLSPSSLTAAEGFQLRSLAWLCFRGAAQWDAFGAASHALINTGGADPARDARGHTEWCAIGTDVAGTNLQQFTSGIQHPRQCDGLCANTSGCTFWTFVASKPGSGQAPYNCFARTDPFRGQNGWTGPPKPDIWVPDSEMECFTSREDWSHLGLVLSPASHTVPFSHKYYTVYPERVTWGEADAFCRQAGGQLAVLDSREALDTAHQALLTTLASQTAIRSAWVGVRGNNTLHNPAARNTSGLAAHPAAAPKGQQLTPAASVPAPRLNVPQPETTLQWLNGQHVVASLLQRLVALPSVWSAHDVIWSIQYVPESDTRVCGRVLHQTLPPDAAAAGDSQPGIWFFDCAKPAGFICESSAQPQQPMAGRTAFTDTADTAHWSQPGINVPVWGIAVATLLPTLAVLLSAWQWTRFKQSRKARRLSGVIWQQRKRLMGPPRHGLLSVVVTDIQDYSRLTNEAPDEMGQALLQHNHVIKQAADDNIGYVLEQEGDSFTLAFRDPADAAAFALQAQQALLGQQWHPAMTYPDSLDASTSTAWLPGAASVNSAGSSSSSSSELTDGGAGPQHVVRQQHVSFSSQQQLLFRGLRVRMGVATGVVAKGNSIKNSPVYKAAQVVSAIGNGGQVLLDEATAAALQGQQPLHHDNSQAGSNWLQHHLLLQRSAAAGHSPAQSAPPLLFDMGCYELLPCGSDAQHSSPANSAELPHTHACMPATRTTRSIALWTPDVGKRFVQRYQSYLEHEQEQHDGDALSTPDSRRGAAFDGFSLASAVHQQQQLQHDEEQPYMLGSYLTQLHCSGELPAAPAGQVQPSLTPHRQQQPLQQQQQQHAALHEAGLLNAGRRDMRDTGKQQQQQQQHGLQAVLHRALGHGVPARKFPQTMSPVQLSSSHTPRLSTTSSKPLHHPRASFDSCNVPALPSLSPTMRLYQLVSPALAGRAAVFGSKLDLPSSWRLLDAPVFFAPGLTSSAAASSFSSRGSPAAQQALKPNPAAAAAPAGPDHTAAVGTKGSNALLQHAAASQCCVSIAVALVEGAEVLQQVPELARSVHVLLHRLMLQLLARHVPGSYLVAAEPDQLRYSAAFSSATAAAAWCLTMQEASLYLPYPDALLGLPGCGVQLDGGGRLLLRGPRLKLGLCEGTPSSITINSMGRAEYAGVAVQHAHRFADSIAQGGQVITSLQLAIKLLQQWQRSDSAGASASTPDTSSNTGDAPAASDTAVAGGSAARRISSDGNSRVSAALKTVRSLPANISALLSHSVLHSDSSASAQLPAAAAAREEDATAAAAAMPIPTPAAGVDASPAGVLSCTQTQAAAARSLHTACAADISSSVAVGATVPVECQVSWLGSFLFKGSHGLVEVAALSPVVLLGRSLGQDLPAAVLAGVLKEQCVVRRGVVKGRASVQLPATLDGWSAD